MVDFAKLNTQKQRLTLVEPSEIFRRLPKPPGINDLYTSQAEVLDAWHKRRSERDIVIKLHTGGGKTLVGLLMAQSTINETNEPVIYLTPTKQLANQTLEKAKALGITAVGYQKGQPLHSSFLNGKAIMVCTYQALFNGKSKFGLRGANNLPTKVSAIILDDAHVAFSAVRDAFTLEVKAEHAQQEIYKELTSQFRSAFNDIDKLGTFDDLVDGMAYGVVEVPYWAWKNKIDVVREIIRSNSELFPFEWPLLRDNLHFCHAIVSGRAFTITPILPLVNSFPTFTDSPRRIYMSATIADDSEIVRTFDANANSVRTPITSRSLAGISERMILIPDLMPFDFGVRDTIKEIVQHTTNIKKYGSVILVPSNSAATEWNDIAKVAIGSDQVESDVKALQDRLTNGPVVLSNRFDGIDLPGDSCRLLIMDGLPTGTSDFELFRAATLFGGITISRMLAQRIEQGIGRGARGAGDHCVVVLAGSDLAGWVAKSANFKLLTSATRAQLDIGEVVSKEVKNSEELLRTVCTCFDRDSDWVRYHAEMLAEGVEVENQDFEYLDLVAAERKAFNLWIDGYPDKAIDRLQTITNAPGSIDLQARGWLMQLAARIANHWGQTERALELQREAYSNNKNLLRPTNAAPYLPLVSPSTQTKAIVDLFSRFRMRRGLLNQFEQTAALLNSNSSSNVFEQALADFAGFIGFVSERHDVHGLGPDVLWILPNKVGLIIEAKSRKQSRSPLNKEEHGQLLVAEEWFIDRYKDYKHYRVSVHPTNKATNAASATGSYALTYDKIALMVSDVRLLLTKLCESQLSNASLEIECAQQLENSNLHSEKFADHYLTAFTSH